MTRSVLRGWWLKLQETPFELAICALAVGNAGITLAAEWSALGVLTIALYLALGVGAFGVCAGRLRYGVTVESAGMALLLAAYVAAVWRILLTLHTWEHLANGVLNVVALVVAFGVRLYVLRKTIRLRRDEPGGPQ